MSEAETFLPASFGALLKVLRKQAGVSQQQLATRLSVHRNTIGAWERGDYLPDGKGMVLEVATQLGLAAAATRHLLEASLTALAAYWCVPYQRNPFFTGRAAILQRLHAVLAPDQPTGDAPIYALCGMGGMGKTQTAVEYAYRHSQEYSAACWITVDTHATALASCKQIAEALGLPERTARDQQVLVAAVMRWLGMHSGWLLVLDNVVDLNIARCYLPAARQGAILLTTQLNALGGLAQSIALPPLPLAEAARFLWRRAGRDAADLAAPDQRAVDAIAALMDGLPLALDQAGAYIEATQCGLPEFLRLFTAAPAALLRERDSAADHPLSVIKTLRLAFAQVRERDATAAALLALCAFFAPAAIPETVLTASPDTLPAELQPLSTAPLRRNAALRVLLAYSLLHRDAVSQTFSLHRLVPTTFRASLSVDEQARWLANTARVLDHHFPADFATAHYWERGEQWLPHARACLEQAEHYDVATPSIAALASKVATYLYTRRGYDEAASLWQRALALYERLPAADQTAMVFCQIGLASIFREQGKSAVAAALFQCILGDFAPADGLPPHYVAFAMSGLATIYYEQGRFAAAEALFTRALEIHEQRQPDEHPWLALVLHDYAMCCVAQGRFAQAEGYLVRAVQIWERIGDDDHPYLAVLLSSLANTDLIQGNFAVARPLFQRAARLVKRDRSAQYPRLD